MKHTRSFSILTAVAMIVSLALPVSAHAETMPTTAAFMSPERAASSAAKRLENTERMAATQALVKTNADKEIDRRIAALRRLTERITAMKRISADQKASLLAQVQTAINDLTALKAKIAADTDAATLRTDKQSIVTSYRIFALLMPKIEIIAHADAILALVTQMTANDATIQAAIAAKQATGKDVSALNGYMLDRQARLTDAQVQAQDAISLVSALTPDGYPDNRGTLLLAADKLKTARTDLAAAYQDAVKIRQGLK